MMSYQDLIAWALLGIALVLAGKKLLSQFGHVEVDPKCKGCPIPDLKKEKFRKSD